MKFYRIKSTEKGVQPPRWFRLLVPSGITFSQLYVLLGYVHGKEYDLSPYFYYENKDRTMQVEEFIDGSPEGPQSYYDKYDARTTFIDTFFSEKYRFSQYTARDFDLTIEVEKGAEDYPDLLAPDIIKVSRAIAEEEGGQPAENELALPFFIIEKRSEDDFRYAEDMAESLGPDSIMQVSENPVTPDSSICKGRKTLDEERFTEMMPPKKKIGVADGRFRMPSDELLLSDETADMFEDL